MVFEKKWYQSKTLWINALAIIGGILTALSGELAVGGTVTVAGVINIGLRLITKQPLK